MVSQVASPHPRSARLKEPGATLTLNVEPGPGLPARAPLAVTYFRSIILWVA